MGKVLRRWATSYLPNALKRGERGYPAINDPPMCTFLRDFSQDFGDLREISSHPISL